MRYGIFKVKYFDSSAYIPAHEDKQKIWYAIEGFEKYDYLLDEFEKELFIEYQTLEDYLQFGIEDSTVCDFLSLFAKDSEFQDWRKLNPKEDPRTFLKLKSYYNMLDS